RTAFVSARDDIHAGSSPDATAARIVAPIVTASTTPSTSNVMYDGGGLSRLRIVACSQSVAPYARATPIVAPMPATSRLSVSIWLTRRMRLAPSDDLMA